MLVMSTAGTVGMECQISLYERAINGKVSHPCPYYDGIWGECRYSFAPS